MAASSPRGAVRPLHHNSLSAWRGSVLNPSSQPQPLSPRLSLALLWHAGTSRDVFARMAKGVTVNTGEPVLQVRRGADGRYSIGLRHDSKLYDKPGNPHDNPNDWLR